MEWMLSWMGFGAAAFVFALINLIRVSGGHTAGSQAFMFGSLSCGLLAMLDEYRRAEAWVKAEDYAALGDVVPWTCTMLMVACFLLIILNLLTVAISMGVNAGKRRRDKKALTEAQKQAAEAVQRAESAEQRAAEAVEAPSAEDWKQMSEENVEKPLLEDGTAEEK
ncbi:MAG: hypothetical protein IJT94_08000 [Oscillibacter sp.]|nr:hypothetical protein [Oscillibacter sp.]